jgi:hypothetical protein
MAAPSVALYMKGTRGAIVDKLRQLLAQLPAGSIIWKHPDLDPDAFADADGEPYQGWVDIDVEGIETRARAIETVKSAVEVIGNDALTAGYIEDGDIFKQRL